MLTLLADGAPLEPSRKDAARWAVEELSRREYHADEPGLVERGLRWAWEQLTRLQVPDGAGSAVVTAILVGLILVAVLAAVRRLGVGGRRARGERRAVLADVRETPEELRALASACAGRHDWAGAVLAMFRALARELEGSAALRPLPGRTAAEIARDAGDVWPDLTGDLASAARLFDGIAYGGRTADPEDYAGVRGLEAAVRDAVRRPPRPTGAATAAAGATTPRTRPPTPTDDVPPRPGDPPR